MDAGAEFLVAPCLVEEVVTWAALNNIVIIPGCQTPSEAFRAYKAGLRGTLRRGHAGLWRPLAMRGHGLKRRRWRGYTERAFRHAYES